MRAATKMNEEGRICVKCLGNLDFLRSYPTTFRESTSKEKKIRRIQQRDLVKPDVVRILSPCETSGAAEDPPWEEVFDSA